MRRAVLLLGLASACAGVTAASAGAPTLKITQERIGKAQLGLTRKQYVRLLGRPSFTTRYGHGLVRLAFAKQELAVYVNRAGRAVAILTSAEEYRTLRRVGPCSSVRALRRAYRGRLVVMRRAGHPVAYRLNRLVFAAPSGKVGAVMLARPGFSASLAVNAGQCGSGEED